MYVPQPAAAAFQGALADIRRAGATLVAISPQTPDQSLRLAERHAIDYLLLSDADNAGEAIRARAHPLEAVTDAMRELGISLDEYNGDGAQTMPAATTCVVAADGAIRSAAASADYRWRVGPQETSPRSAPEA